MLVAKILREHNIEVWEGYAVEGYTRLVDGDWIPGDMFTPLTDLDTKAKLYIWLGY